MNILQAIVQSKRSEFPNWQSASTPGAPASGRLLNKAASETCPFLRALQTKNTTIIGEVKPKSPSSGQLLQETQLDHVLTTYKTHCAAVSVLTDEKFFGGSFELLACAKEKTGLPILCKDFIVSPAQLALAKQHGADAILLIAKILERHNLITLLDAADIQGLTPVVEINDENDLRKIEGLLIDVVLINNRNLDTMKIELSTTERLATQLAKDQIVISASGIKTQQDVEQLLPSANRFLIGTSLMQSPAPEVLLKQFASTTPPVKICGITNPQDADFAIAAGARLIGIILANSSKRKVSSTQARAIAEAARGRAKLVGVFQYQGVDEVNATAEELNLDFIQLHGDEDQEFIKSCVRPVIKTFTYDQSKSQSLTNFSAARYFLFDLDKDRQSDSNNTSQRLKSLAQSLAPIRHLIPPFFLAGGLNPGNVRRAMDIIRPFGIDVASGVESSPGNKSPNLVTDFLKATHIPTGSAT